MEMREAGGGRFNNDPEEFARFCRLMGPTEEEESEKEERERERVSRECRRQPALLRFQVQNFKLN